MLTTEQSKQFDERGFLVLEDHFQDEELRLLREAFARDKARDGEHRVIEDDGRSVRAVYAPHLRDDTFAWLAEHHLMLAAAKRLVGAELYVYQFKVNTKRAFGGGAWAWHQDYIAWRLADGLPAPRAVTVAVFLDDVTEFNGPMIFIPGSHRSGTIEPPSQDDGAGTHLDPKDIELSSEQVADLASEHGMEAPKGAAGSVLVFHPEVVHASAQNVSPFSRDLALITYNAVDNLPTHEKRRPEYLVGRPYSPLAERGSLAGA